MKRREASLRHSENDTVQYEQVHRTRMGYLHNKIQAIKA